MIIWVRLRRSLMKKPILGLAAHQATKLARPAGTTEHEHVFALDCD
jgi:hypothetical protein